MQAGVSAVSPVLALFVSGLVQAREQWQRRGIAHRSDLGIDGGDQRESAASLAGKMSDRIGHARMIAICALGGGLLYLQQAFVQTA